MRNLLTATVGLLALANIMYWWPSRETISHSAYAQLPLLIEIDDLQSLELLPEENDTLERDLFSPVIHEPEPVAVVMQPKVTLAPQAIKEPEIRSGEKKSAVGWELDNYRLVGVLMRHGKQTAYMLNGSIPLDTNVGDMLSDNVVVLSVNNNGAILKDIRTGNTKQLLLSGE